MTTRAFLLRTALLALVAPAACGGETSDPGGSVAGAAGASGGGAGSGASAGSGAGAAGSPAGGGSGAGGSVQSAKFPCANPTPVLVGGQPTGFEVCANSTFRRPAATACPSLLPRAAACVGPDSPMPQCKTDQDCTAMPHGRCDVPSSFLPVASSCSCSYGCTTDAECGKGEICQCGDPVGTCVPSGCTTDADCPAGACLSGALMGGCGPSPEFACQTDADECAVDADCPAAMHLCAVVNARRTCVQQVFCGGRPLLVGTALRLAPLATGGGWG